MKRLRIAFLLYVLLFAAIAQFFTTARSKDWDTPLWVDVYTVAGDDDDATRSYLATVEPMEFEAVATFFAQEAKRHALPLTQPFRLRVVGEFSDQLPGLGPSPGPLDVAFWSLRMRWLTVQLRWADTGPSGDIVMFAVFHRPTADVPLDRSTALQKGLIGVANLFAADDARGTNDVVIAHELLHTLSATDKYSLTTNLPLFPGGYAAPDATPLLPQTRAELMAGRIPLSTTSAAMPASLRDVVIGAETAAEIGW